MADLITSLITLFILLLVTHLPICMTSSAPCSISKCGGPGAIDVRFPFKFKGSDQPTTCGHPGFDVWCDHRSNQTLLELPSSGKFTIKSIDYVAQEIWVNDPNKCLPQRLLSFDLFGSPFSTVYNQDFAFFNCSTVVNNHNKTTASTTSFENLVGEGPIDCLNGTNYFVYAVPSNGTNLSHPTTCSLMVPMVKVPVQWPPSLHNATFSPSSSKLNEDLRLSWFMPECRECELNGQMCGMETNSSGSNVIVCTNIPSSKVSGSNKFGKLPVTTFIAVILIICSPTIICLVGSLWIWIRGCYEERPIRLQENRSVATQRPGHLVELGLEEAQVEFAREMVLLGLSIEANPEFRPTIVLSEIDEMGLSPTREGENECAICMAEYRPKNRIGTLPTCGHFFHADCINKWLSSRGIIERNCPICRASVV